MSEADRLLSVKAAHEERFGAAPEVAAWAPGRVNLLGEHTDYNGGFVLPIALRDLGVAIAVAQDAEPGVIELYSATLQDSDTRAIDEEAAGRWSDYVLGCFKKVAVDRVARSGLRVTLMTTLPLGVGLSSSAALEVAAIRAAVRLFDLQMSPVEMAVAARQVENVFVGMPCGIMDQFASSVGDPGTALFLDTRTLEFTSAPALPGFSFVVIDSGVSHQLTDSGYATRVAECKAACEALGVEMLSDLTDADLPRIDALPEPLNRRARHVVTDNRLTQEGLAALQSGDAEAFGLLMVESHATEKDNYEITVPETDALAAAALEEGAIGARQTGGGFGGAVVALAPDEKIDDLCAALTTRYSDARILAVT